MSGFGLTDPSPPSHVRSTDCPAVIFAGGFVNAIMVLWAIAATTKVAHARRVRDSIVCLCCVDARRKRKGWY